MKTIEQLWREENSGQEPPFIIKQANEEGDCVYFSAFDQQYKYCPSNIEGRVNVYVKSTFPGIAGYVFYQSFEKPSDNIVEALIKQIDITSDL